MSNCVHCGYRDGANGARCGHCLKTLSRLEAKAAKWDAHERQNTIKIATAHGDIEIKPDPALRPGEVVPFLVPAGISVKDLGPSIGHIVEYEPGLYESARAIVEIERERLMALSGVPRWALGTETPPASQDPPQTRPTGQDRRDTADRARRGVSVNDLAPIRFGEPVEVAVSWPGGSAHWFGWLERVDDDGTIHLRPRDLNWYVQTFCPDRNPRVFRATKFPWHMERSYTERHLEPRSG